MQLPHVKIMYEEMTSQTICLPFSSNTWAIWKSDEMWYMKHLIINQAQNNANTTPDPLEFNVYCSLDDVKLYGLIDESKEGVPISGKLAYISSMLQKASTVLPYVTPWQKLAASSASVALSLGYSRPITVPQKMMVSRTATTLSYLSGEPDFSSKLSVDPAVSRSVESFHPLSTPGELDLYKQLQTYDFLERFSSSVPIVVHPMWTNMGDKQYPTRLMYLTGMFKYWTGTIKYKVEFVANSLLRQNFAIVIFPPGEPMQTTYTGTPKLQTYIIEVCGRTMFEFEVPYLHVTPLSTVPGTWFSGSPHDAETRFRIFEITPCTGQSGTTTPLDYNVYIKAGDTYEVSVPNMNFHNHHLIEESQTIEITGERLTNLKQLLSLPIISTKQDTVNCPTTDVYTIPVVPHPSRFWDGHAAYPTLVERISAMFVCATGSLRIKILQNLSGSICSSIESSTQLYPKVDYDGFGTMTTYGMNEHEVLILDKHQFFNPQSHFTVSSLHTKLPNQCICYWSKFLTSFNNYVYVSAADDYLVSGFLCLPGLSPNMIPPNL